MTEEADPLLTPKSIKAQIKEIGFGPGWGGNCATWITAALICGSVDKQTVREFMGYKEWFDTCATKLKDHGYLYRGKLWLPQDLFEPELATVSLILIGMEIDGLVVSVPPMKEQHALRLRKPQL